MSGTTSLVLARAGWTTAMIHPSNSQLILYIEWGFPLNKGNSKRVVESEFLHLSRSQPFCEDQDFIILHVHLLMCSLRHSRSLYLNLEGHWTVQWRGMVPFPCKSWLLTFILFFSLTLPSFPFPKIFIRNYKEKLFSISLSWLPEFFIQDTFSHLPAVLVNPERSQLTGNWQICNLSIRRLEGI